MVGVMHEWVQAPDAYDLERAAPKMIDALIVWAESTRRRDEGPPP